MQQSSFDPTSAQAIQSSQPIASSLSISNNNLNNDKNNSIDCKYNKLLSTLQDKEAVSLLASICNTDSQDWRQYQWAYLTVYCMQKSKILKTQSNDILLVLKYCKHADSTKKSFSLAPIHKNDNVILSTRNGYKLTKTAQKIFDLKLAHQIDKTMQDACNLLVTKPSRETLKNALTLQLQKQDIGNDGNDNANDGNNDSNNNRNDDTNENDQNISDSEGEIALRQFFSTIKLRLY